MFVIQLESTGFKTCCGCQLVAFTAMLTEAAFIIIIVIVLLACLALVLVSIYIFIRAGKVAKDEEKQKRTKSKEVEMKNVKTQSKFLIFFKLIFVLSFSE
jgi:hypothetical protein